MCEHGGAAIDERALFKCPKCGGTVFDAANIQTIRERCLVEINAADDYSFDVFDSWDEEIQSCTWESDKVKCENCGTVTDLGPYILGDLDGMDTEAVEKGGSYGHE